VTTPVAAAPKAPAVWEDFIDIFHSPSAVFERRRDGRFGLALLILCVLLAVIVFATYRALAPAYEAMIERGIAAQAASNPEMNQEQALAAARRFGPVTVIGGILIGTPVAILLTGAALWLVGKLFDAKQTFAQAAMVATYANVPRLLGALVSGAQAIALGGDSLRSPFQVTLSPARFVDPDTTSVTLQTLLSRFDLFTLWATALLAIGLSVTGGISRSKAAIAAALVWLLGGLVLVAQAGGQ